MEIFQICEKGLQILNGLRSEDQFLDGFVLVAYMNFASKGLGRSSLSRLVAAYFSGFPIPWINFIFIYALYEKQFIVKELYFSRRRLVHSLQVLSLIG
jgi:hypothetical protein